MEDNKKIRDLAPQKEVLKTLKKHKNLFLVDVKCIDCGKDFKWYLDTKRCSVCKTLYSRTRYVKKDNYPLTPMVIVNSKGCVIGEVNRPSQIKKWFLNNTKIKKERLEGCNGLRYALKKAKKEGNLGVKYICYWIMYKNDYTLSNVISLINKVSKNKGKIKPRAKSDEVITKILNVFNEEGLHKDIAKKYNVSRSWVARIKTGNIHSSVTGKQYEKTYNLAGI